MELIFWTLVIIIVYVYIGYPITLGLLNILIKKPVRKDESFVPSVSLMMSAYNEEKIIRKKIENSLSLNYPKDKLQIIIVSDGSTDSTDEIIKEYASDSLIHLRHEERKGKSIGLNKTVELASGGILIFSDANAIYEKDAIKKLVRNFKDDTIGYVTGEARYIDKKSKPADACEKRYWNYEIFLKKKESLLGSMVGGDGAIYAIRKELFSALEANDISDFLNPLQIVAKGWRGIYEPEAICYEEAAGSFESEFRRKVRIISRSWKAVTKVPGILNPLKNGLFALQLVSHKILRWYVPFFLLTVFIISLILGLNNSFYHVIFILQVIFYSFAFFTHIIKPFWKFKKELFYLPYYFCTVNCASLIGISKALSGQVPSIWEPQRTNKKGLAETYNLKHETIVLLAIFSIFIIVVIVSWLYKSFSIFLLWSNIFIISYVYFGYPTILILLTKLKKNKITKRDQLLTVTLLIPAHNEEEIIEEKIKNSLSLDYPDDRLKIIIASDGSIDRTNEIVQGYKDQGIILFAFSPRRGKMSTLNQAIKLIDTELIVFSDANVMYQSNAILKLVRNFQDSNVGAVSGDVILLNEANSYGGGERLYYRYERFIQQKESELESIVGVDGAMYAIRRSLYQAPSDNIILDDFVLSMQIARSGHRVIYEPEAKGFEKSPGKAREDFKRKIRIIAGAIQAIKQREGLPRINQISLLFEYVSHKLLRWFVPFFALILFFTNLSLLGESSYYNILFLLQIGFYIFALLGTISRLSSIFISIPFYFCMVNIAAFIGILKGLTNKQKTTWQIVR